MDIDAARADRLRWLERAGDDFPFYDGQPVALSGRAWAAVLGAVVAAYLVLTLAGPLAAAALGSVIWARLALALVFVALPLVVLARVAPQGWRALFRSVTWRDVAWMFGFAMLNMIVVFGVVALLMPFLRMTVNPIAGVRLPDLAAWVGFLAWMAIQLVGEELLTILPFLALLTWGRGRLGLGRRGAILLAWAGSTLAFSLAHLPTYNWNLLQCLAVVGTLRLVLSMAYLRTKNLWVSAGAHIIYDLTIFTAVMLAGTLAPPPA